MPEPNYKYLENKSRKQHYVSILIERLAGKDPQTIAETLHMTKQSVCRDLEYVQRNWSVIFSPEGSTERPKASSGSGFGPLKIEAKCKGCGTHIAEGDDRLVVAVLEPADLVTFDEVYEENDTLADCGGTYENMADKTSSSHYCRKCSVSLPEFHINNPAFGDDESADASQIEQTRIEKPTLVQHSGTPFQSGEDVQKKALRALLDHPNSACMRPDMRTAAQMWVEGSSQTEIAKKMGKNQSTVCRLLAAARQMATAPRYASY